MSRQRDRWVITRQRIRTDVAATFWLWLPFLVLVAAFTILFDRLVTDVTASAWEMASHVPRWFAAGMGVYLSAVYLPLYIAHGQTRRQFAVQAPVFVLVFVIVLALLMTSGYAIERAIYDIAGWPQVLRGTHLFQRPDQYPLVFTEFVLSFVVWTVSGALVGAAFYRNSGLGFLLFPVGLSMAAGIQMVIGFTGVEEGFHALLRIRLEPKPLPMALITAAGCSALGIVLAWAIIRDLPIRSKAA
jgi:hypothetical protein